MIQVLNAAQLLSGLFFFKKRAMNRLLLQKIDCANIHSLDSYRYKKLLPLINEHSLIGYNHKF